MTQPAKTYKYYELIMAAFVAVLLCSNLIGPAKVVQLDLPFFGKVDFGAGNLFMSWVVLTLPASPDEPFSAQLQPALVTCFGSGWRIAVGSLIAFFIGDFLNSYVLAKLKVRTKGKHLWMRTIGSTIVGQAVDSLVFYPLAFFGIWSTSTLLAVMFANWCFKVAVEIFMTPVTYWTCAKLKSVEGVDAYDTKTDFTPFTLKA